MHFVPGHGNVADSPLDEQAHVLYAKISYFDGEIERVGQIVKWGRSDDSFTVTGLDSSGKFREAHVKWQPLFQRFESRN